jgi:hypothetical protein
MQLTNRCWELILHLRTHRSQDLKRNGAAGTLLNRMSITPGFMKIMAKKYPYEGIQWVVWHDKS